jgi:hypothetical protein
VSHAWGEHVRLVIRQRSLNQEPNFKLSCTDLNRFWRTEEHIPKDDQTCDFNYCKFIASSYFAFAIAEKPSTRGAI